jgi:hypothetical protein
MARNPVAEEQAREHLAAELADVAYRVALRHGLKGPFIDVELELWRTFRAALARRGEGVPCAR